MTYRMRIAAALLSVTVGTAAAPAQDAETPVKVTEKPQASARGCRPGTSGRTSVRVTFDKIGKITAANTVSASGCGPFDQQAVRAARNIKFVPAKRKGTPVTTVKIVEYSYAVY